MFITEMKNKMEEKKDFWEEEEKSIGKVTRIKKGLSFKESCEIAEREARKGKTICLTDVLINREKELLGDDNDEDF